MFSKLEIALGGYIVSRIRRARPDLDISLYDNHVKWVGTLVANWGALRNYFEEEEHPTFVGYKINGQELTVWGGGDGVFHYGKKCTVSIPDASSKKQLSKIISNAGFVEVLESGIVLAKRIPRKDRVHFKGYK